MVRVMRTYAVLGPLVALAIGYACGDARETPPEGAGPSASDSPTPGIWLLADGEFLDSRPIAGQGDGFGAKFSLPQAVERADAIVIVHDLQVADEADLTSVIRDESGQVVHETLISPITTYVANVEQWIKGAGGGHIMIAWWGGVKAGGLRFTDGGFLPQPGRRYLLLLSRKTPDLPGPGEFETTGAAGYEVTDGLVHVVNHSLWQDLQDAYGGMPEADFVQVLNGFINATPSPAATP
jgi:hypothetical protein